jgi:hypothetical protein
VSKWQAKSEQDLTAYTTHCKLLPNV